MAENQCCVTGKDLQVGGERERTRGSWKREGAVGEWGVLKEELGPRRKRDDWKSKTRVKRKKVRPRQDRGKVAEGRKKCAVVKEREQQC